jgi:multidrug efflux pump subunit AcrB
MFKIEWMRGPEVVDSTQLGLETINVMALGGLALAVGILVDDATVTIENINWHLERGKEIQTAILDGARQIVIPATVSLMCICIAFVPMFGLGGVAGYLFRPLARPWCLR